jgi:hypothetical protein
MDEISYFTVIVRFFYLLHAITNRILPRGQVFYDGYIYQQGIIYSALPSD